MGRVATHPVDGRRDIVERGAVSIDRGGELDRRDLSIFLAAGMHESNGIAFDSGASDFGIWPPLWPVLEGEGDRGQVALTIRLSGSPRRTTTTSSARRPSFSMSR
jgi:hypothetical protein